MKKAGKNFEDTVGSDRWHTAESPGRVMEFFI